MILLKYRTHHTHHLFDHFQKLPVWLCWTYMSSITKLVHHLALIDKNALESNDLNIAQVSGYSSLGKGCAKSHDGLIFEIHQLSTHGISSLKPRKTNSLSRLFCQASDCFIKICCLLGSWQFNHTSRFFKRNIRLESLLLKLVWIIPK